MIAALPELPKLVVILLGALLAGFTTGFAGFGTGLVTSGLWFHALPAPMVPPLVAMSSVIAQLIGIITVRKAFDWRRAKPFLIGGSLGVPMGIAALRHAPPDVLRTSVGAFLVAYALFQIIGGNKPTLEGNVGLQGSKRTDLAVGVGGGFLGGFSGLSGPLPLIWLQLQGGPSDRQRATYQPFNLVVLSLASIGMVMSGQINQSVWAMAGLCLPVTLVGAWLGARIYAGVSETTFRLVVLILLLTSGVILVGQAVVLS